MSLKVEWKKLETRWKAWWARFKAAHLVAPDPTEASGGAASSRAPAGNAAPARQDAAPPEGKAGALPAPSRASCWEGSNAQTRHMNTLSPAFSDEQAADRFQWAAERGCNTVHLFVANQGDGEGAGYSIYGGAPTPGKVDAAAVERMAARLRKARAKGLAPVLWLLADDSSKWNKALLADPARYAADLKGSGLLDLAAAVVLGLEMDEYMDAKKASALAAAVRGVWSGPVGTHHTSGKGTFAALGDLLFWQVKPGASAAQMKAETAKAAKLGKPVVMFELDRQPNRPLCQAALDAGAAGVGNW